MTFLFRHLLLVFVNILLYSCQARNNEQEKITTINGYKNLFYSQNGDTLLKAKYFAFKDNIPFYKYFSENNYDWICRKEFNYENNSALIVQYYPDSVCRNFYVPLTIELKKQLLFKEDDCFSYDYTEKIDADIIFDKHDIIRQYDLRDTEGSLVYRAFCDTEGYITNDDPNSMAVNCYIEKSGSIYNKDTIYIERGDTISLVELRILNFNKYSISLKLEYIVSPESTANSYKNTNIPVIVDRKELSKYRILNKIHFKEKGTFQFIDKGTLSLRDSIVKKYNSYSPIIIVK